MSAGAEWRSLWSPLIRLRAGVIRLQAVRYLHVLTDQRDPGRVSLHLQQRSEILAPVAVPDQALDELMDERRHRQRHLALPRGGQPQVEVLAQQRGGERGVEVQVH